MIGRVTMIMHIRRGLVGGGDRWIINDQMGPRIGNNDLNINKWGLPSYLS